jgi:hypothetical protein
VSFTVAANSGQARTGNVVIAGQRSTVTQAAVAAPTPPPGPPPPSCTFTISPTSQNVGAGGGSGSVSVTSQAGCPWTATSSASWITVTSGSTGTGSGSVAFTVGANVGPARTGSLTIAGRTFTVSQAALCTYALSKAGENVRANEGSASVNVTTMSACAWTATSNSSWLIVQSSGGTGNGQVTYNIRENTGGARIGSLTVAGYLFRVEQDGR